MNVHDTKKENSGTGKTATMKVADRTIEMPVRSGTLGPDVIDISRLHRETGCFTYDPGFTSTANCMSKITYIDGDNGILLYRGYPIDQLAERSSFLETCSLLLHGDLPTAEQFASFQRTIRNHTMLHEQMTRFYTGFRRDAHPMALLARCRRSITTRPTSMTVSSG